MYFSSEQIKIFIICCIIFTIFYMIVYTRKRNDKSIFSYIKAIYSSFAYMVCAIFVIVGFNLIILLIKEKEYFGLIIPIVWFGIVYSVIKQILKRDFDINIQLIRDNIKLTNVFKLLPFIIMAVFLTILVIVLFGVLQDTENQPYGPFSIMLVILVMLSILFIIINHIYNSLKKENTKKRIINVKYIACIIALLMGLLFMWVGMYDSLTIWLNKDDYVKTDAKLIDAKRTDDDDDVLYSLVYSYEVDGEVYNMTTNYAVSNVPEIGSIEKIYYDVNNPDKAIILDESLYIFAIMGLLFSVASVVALKKIQNNNDESVEVIE